VRRRRRGREAIDDVVGRRRDVEEGVFVHNDGAS